MDGERIRRTTKLRSDTPLQDIRAAIRDIEAEAKAAALARRRFRFNDLADLYLERPDKDLHDSNVKIANRWKDCLGGLVLRDINAARIEGAAMMMGGGCQPQSVQKYKRILSAILNYGSDLGYLPVVPKFKIGRTRKARLVYLLDHELDELLEVAAQKHPHMLGFCLLAPRKTTPLAAPFSDSPARGGSHARVGSPPEALIALSCA